MTSQFPVNRHPLMKLVVARLQDQAWHPPFVTEKNGGAIQVGKFGALWTKCQPEVDRQAIDDETITLDSLPSYVRKVNRHPNQDSASISKRDNTPTS